MAFLYLDPFSRDFEVMLAKTSERGDGVSFDVVDDALIAEQLFEFASGKIGWDQTRDFYVCALGLHDVRRIDPRIAKAMACLLEQPARAVQAADLARSCELSVTRFQHLFSEATGLPFRRYRLWCRLAAALRTAHVGGSLTEAAYAAGLASSAHLSSSFRDMFGLAPSELNIRSLRFIEVQ